MKEDNLFVTIKGRKIFWEAFIRGMDYYRSEFATSRTLSEKYNRMIYPIQDLTLDWHNGETDTLSDDSLNFLKRYDYAEPTERHLPEVLNELFLQMQSCLRISLDKLLDNCAKLSDSYYSRHMEERDKQRKWRKKVKQLADMCHSFEYDHVFHDVEFLFALQKAKKNDTGYEMKDEELIATRLLANLLIQNSISEYVTWGMLQSLYLNAFLSPEDIDDLLMANNDKRDSEWYLEDMERSNPEEEIDFKVGDVLKICMDRLLDAIGIENEYLNQKQ